MKNKNLKGGKMEKKYVYGIVALTMVIVLGVSMISAFGFSRGFMNPDLTEEEKTEMQEQREAMETAVENKDYESWESLMLERVEKMKAQITEENFNNLAERHEKISEFRTAVEKLKESGELDNLSREVIREKMQEIQEEYGIESSGFGRGFGRGPKMGMKGGCPFAE